MILQSGLVHAVCAEQLHFGYVHVKSGNIPESPGSDCSCISLRETIVHSSYLGWRWILDAGKILSPLSLVKAAMGSFPHLKVA